MSSSLTRASAGGQGQARMFTRADRYLATGFLRYTLGMLLGLLSLFVLAAVIDQLGDLGKGKYNLALLAQYVLLSMPLMAYDLIPLAILLGVMAFLSVLASHSELIALRMAGWSLFRLARPLWLVGGLAGLAMFALSEWVIPHSMPWAESVRASALNPGKVLQMRGGEIWFRERDSIFRVRAIEGDGSVLRGVLVLYTPSFAGLRGGYVAESGYYAQGVWHLRNVQETLIGEDRLRMRSIPQLAWRSTITPRTLRSFAQKTDMMSLGEIWYAWRGIQTVGLKSNELGLAWWRRLTYPWVGLVMVAVALPFSVRGSRGGGVASRLLTGLFLGLAFHFLNQMGGYISVAGGIPPWFSALLPLLLFSLIAWYFLARAP